MGTDLDTGVGIVVVIDANTGVGVDLGVSTNVNLDLRVDMCASIDLEIGIVIGASLCMYWNGYKWEPISSGRYRCESRS